MEFSFAFIFRVISIFSGIIYNCLLSYSYFSVLSLGSIFTSISPEKVSTYFFNEFLCRKISFTKSSKIDNFCICFHIYK